MFASTRENALIAHPRILKGDSGHEEGNAGALRAPVMVIEIYELEARKRKRVLRGEDWAHFHHGCMCGLEARRRGIPDSTW